MVFSQVLAGFHAAIGVVGLPGNLLVIATICTEISCDAVGSTCQLSRIRYSIFDPCLTMVVWRNDV